MTARSQKYQAATDDEQDQILKGRLRQLELEHFGHVLQQQEEEADTHVTDAQREQTAKAIESIEARIEVLRGALAARPKRKATDGTSTDSQPTAT